MASRKSRTTFNKVARERELRERRERKQEKKLAARIAKTVGGAPPDPNHVIDDETPSG
jgi:hypothetical protein